MDTASIHPPNAYDPIEKEYQRGTHRSISPEETFRRVSRFMQSMGITRVADVTGLDSIGVPVAMAYRPNSRSLAVSPGKGLTLAAAKTSALMESVEMWHAERIHAPLVLASMNELRFDRELVDVAALPRRSGGEMHANLRILWIEGKDLIGNKPMWVPFELVHLNYTLPLPTSSGALLSSSNGLASGNHVLEAMSHGLCEVIERDALTLWRARSEGAKAERKLDPASIDDPSCRAVLERFEKAGCFVGVWDLTSDIGVPVYRCAIVDREPSFGRSYLPGFGSGCHPSREVALLRALTEAAQTRLTLISGARDDMNVGQYALSKDRGAHTQIIAEIDGTGTRPFDRTPSGTTTSLNGDVAWEIERLKSVGVTQVIALNLTKPAVGIPVVRVVVPGLESIPEAAGYIPGARYRKLVAELAS